MQNKIKILDSHQHFWELKRKDYGWLNESCGILFKDYTLNDYLHDIQDSNNEYEIIGSVLVQAAPTEQETQYLLDIAKNSNGMIRGVVGWIDMLDQDSNMVINRLDKLISSSLLVGIRPMLQDIQDEKWILNSKLEPVIQSLIKNNLCFDALVKKQHLPYLKHFILRHPQLKIVIDHAAKPKIMGNNNGFLEWYENMKCFATIPHVYCKLSGLFTEIIDPPPPNGNLESIVEPYIKSLVQLYTPKRLIWGSDWPNGSTAV
eukprot:gene2269-2792_t